MRTVIIRDVKRKIIISANGGSIFYSPNLKFVLFRKELSANNEIDNPN
jgi:hypothetical protein